MRKRPGRVTSIVYSSVWWKVLLSLGMGLTLVPLLGMSRGAFQRSSGFELITIVNQVRAANGLDAYEINDQLMAIAQAHSEYQADIGTVTHSGADGSRVRDRAAAAGYGEGRAILVSENIAAGTNLAAQMAVQIWQGDTPQIDTMLSAEARDVGAGVAKNGEMVYYTLVVGYIGEVEAAQSPTLPPTQLSGSSVQPTLTPTASPSMLIQTATPQADGALMHLVEPGQSLWNIATAYGVTIDELIRLNNLPANPVIHPGDQILVRQMATPKNPVAPSASQQTLTPQPKDTPVPTARPKRTLASNLNTPAARAASLQASSTPAHTQTAAESDQRSSLTEDPLLMVIAVLVLGGGALLGVGSVLRRGGVRRR